MDLQKKIKTVLDETRMLILGGQILLGFELRGVFADTFDQLPAHSRYLDAVGLGLMVVVIALLIAPEPTTASLRADRTAAPSIAGDTAGLVAGLGTFTLLLGLWYVYPPIVASWRAGACGTHRGAAAKPQRQSG